MRFISRQGNLNDCEKGVRYVDFTGDAELFEVRLNDDGSNPECIKNLGKVCFALTVSIIAAFSFSLAKSSGIREQNSAILHSLPLQRCLQAAKLVPVESMNLHL